MKRTTKNLLRKIIKEEIRRTITNSNKRRKVSITNSKRRRINESNVKKKINRRGDVDGLIVTHNGNNYEIVYSGDFTMSSAIQPYGIVMPGDDVVSFLGKDKNAKSIWKQLKPKVDKFLKSNKSVNERVLSEKTVYWNAPASDEIMIFQHDDGTREEIRPDYDGEFQFMGKRFDVNDVDGEGDFVTDVEQMLNSQLPNINFEYDEDLV